MEKLAKLVDVNNIELDQLLYWNQKLKKEINKRIVDTRCPFCMGIIGERGLEYCNICGNKIEWVWED